MFCVIILFQFCSFEVFHGSTSFDRTGLSLIAFESVPCNTFRRRTILICGGLLVVWKSSDKLQLGHFTFNFINLHTHYLYTYTKIHIIYIYILLIFYFITITLVLCEFDRFWFWVVCVYVFVGVLILI